MHRLVVAGSRMVTDCVGSSGKVTYLVNVFSVFFTIQNTIWDSFTKRMFCLDKHKISPEFLCYPVDNVDKSV